MQHDVTPLLSVNTRALAQPRNRISALLRCFVASSLHPLFNQSLADAEVPCLSRTFVCSCFQSLLIDSTPSNFSTMKSFVR